MRVVVNLCRDRFRRRAVRERAAPRLVLAGNPSERGPESTAVARSTVARALEQLPPRRRAMVVLRELEDKDVTEIASLLGCSAVTVRWHLSVAKKELAAWLISASAEEPARKEER